MANKLYLDNKDYDVPYEPSASEDEYSEEEKQILKEVREGNKRKVDKKQEILAFDESDDEDGDGNDDIIGDSDIERGDDDDGIPDSRAWGKQRRAYYNTDFVDQDYSAYNEQEEEQAQQEEEEAKAIQLRLAKQLDEADFFVDLPTGAADSDDEVGSKIKSKDEKIEEKIKFDLSGMSQRQKQQLFEKDSPEFAGLISDFQIHLSESQTLLTPILEFAKEKELNLPIFDFVQTKNNMILTYCSNITFYLLLKAKRIQIKNHPVTKRLVQLRKLLIQLQQKYDDVVKPQLESLLERINSGEEVQIDLRPPEKKPTKKLRMMNAFSDDEGESDEEYEDAPTAKRAKLSDEEGASSNEEAEEEDDETIDKEEAERRGITYQIAKNKGLTPHRKKELRNPRVKHRSKFRKALIRRKGAVRTVRKETTRYGGEVSGIKATVKKGIKIRS